MTNTRRFKFTDYEDPSTKVKVRRLTPEDMPCVRNYFYQKCFTSDGNRLIFGAESSNTTNIWMLELKTGQARQISEGCNVNAGGAFLSDDDTFVYFTRAGKTLCRINLESLKEEVIWTIPDGWTGYGSWSPNTGCSHVAALVMKEEDRLTDGKGWERFARQFQSHPRMRLLDIDCKTGTSSIVFEENRFLGHPMFRPFHDNSLGFCHEGPHDLVDARIWFINKDGSGLKNIREGLAKECCMHEFWVPDGSALFYVGYHHGERERSIWSYNPETDHNTLIMKMPPCAHLMSNTDGTLLVGDGAGQLGDISDKTAFKFESDRFIYLFDLLTRTYRPICEHNTSWAEYHGNTQATHPHPSFTPDNRQILFTSDVSGILAIYLSEIPT